MTLTKERQGEIALALLKLEFKKSRKSLNAQELKRVIGDFSKKTGFEKEELAEFAILLVKETAEEFISLMQKK